MIRKFLSALKTRAKVRINRLKPESKELALELALSFLIYALSDGIDNEELEDLEVKFKALKDSHKPLD